MKPTFTAISFAIAMSLAAGVAQSADHPVTGASSVAEMLQRKHDTELRAELVRDGRTEDISKLDAVTAQRAETQRGHAYEQVNAQFAKDAGADGAPLNARALDCDPDAMHVR